MGSQIVLCPYRSTANTTLSDGTVVTGLGALMEQYAEALRSVSVCNMSRDFTQYAMQHTHVLCC